jgi:hypothetical protein
MVEHLTGVLEARGVILSFTFVAYLGATSRKKDIVTRPIALIGLQEWAQLESENAKMAEKKIIRLSREFFFSPPNRRSAPFYDAGNFEINIWKLISLLC